MREVLAITSKKTAAGLVAYAKAQVGLPYWWGTYGQTASSSLLSSLKKQYASTYNQSLYSDCSSQYGKRVHDCSGLIKGYLWSDSATSTPKYNGAQDKSAQGFYSSCSKSGKISSFPKTKGALVFNSGLTHVGIYDGNGYVYEAKGHAYGVVKSKYAADNWAYWGLCCYIDYGSSSSSSSSGSTSSSGSSGSSSSGSKTTSTTSSTKLTVDGQIGPKTCKKLQKVMGTTQDGTIDGQPSGCKKYWTSILSSVCKWSGGKSDVVKALQKYVTNKGYKTTADGQLGTKTAKAVQQFLIAKKYLNKTYNSKTNADGYFGSRSAKALQKWLNAN